MMDKTWHNALMRMSPRESILHYLPYSKEDEKLGMVCTTAGSIDTAPNTVYPANKNDHPVAFRQVAVGRTLPEFQIVYISRGKGVFGCDEKNYRVEPGSMLLLLPGIRHFYKPDIDTGWSEHWVGFNGEYFTRLVEKGILSRKQVFFMPGLRDFILNTFNQIIEEVRAQRPLFQLKACSGVISLISEMLASERRKEQPNFYQKIVEKAKCLMESNVYGAINVPNIAEQIGVSTSRLNEIFKTYTAMTPYQYFIHIKIHRAENILGQENISIKEAAFNLGFEDQYYFSRLFRSKTGMSPTEWKKSISG
ncbi:transcriptional regulator [Spirochaetia bacterium]|nr:transcriptional regulator [Spirochaetia bacterium]